MSELDVEICSHFFRVTRITVRSRPAVQAFAKKFAQWGYNRVPTEGGRARVVYEMLRVFAAATGDRSEYRFHIHELEKFREHLKANWLTENLVSFTTRPMYEPVKVQIPIQAHWTDREHQPPVIEYLTAPEPVQKLVELQTGKGKAQPLDAKIKVPGGWKTMGEMREGDPLIAPDGTVTSVTGVHPQGEREVFKVTFADGRSTECCSEHLWEVFYINTQPHCRWRVVNTLEVLRLISMPNPRVYVRLMKPEKAPQIDLPMDPYVFGLLLGDGHIGNQTLRLSSADSFIVEQVTALLPSDLQMTRQRIYDYGIVRSSKTYLKNSYLEVFRELGLGGKLSHEKFIPEVYLNGSFSQKLFVLQGLLDTDGTVQQSGSVSYSTTSLELAKGVQYLIRSIGGIAAIHLRTTSFTHQGEKKEGRTCYDVDIRYSKPSLLFRLPRKLARINDANQYAETLKLRVVSVEPVGRKEVQCISVAHPERLYITDDFIVTHNSYCAMRAFSILAYRTVLIMRASFLTKWHDDIMRTCDLTADDVMVIQGGADLMALIDLAKCGMLTAKIILLSNKTYQNWIKLYENMREETLDAGYGCLPDQLYEVLGAGIRAIDEVHMDFHLNFKIDLYTHVPHSMSLSATLITEDRFVESMHDVAYPAIQRYKGDAYDRYVAARAVIYRLEYPNKVRTKAPGTGSYSHHEFEKSIIRREPTLRNYMNLIRQVVQGGFFRKDYRKGDRCIVFCISIDMCTRVTEFLKSIYPTMDIRRYVEDDPYENLMEAEISVSTLQSAGTAVDIDQLTTAILTIAIASSAGNIQGFGRLRNLKDGRTPEFYYFVCEDVRKHIDYHERKRVLLETRALSYKSLSMPNPV